MIECPACGRQYKNFEDLAGHIHGMHTGGKPYAGGWMCFCGRVYRWCSYDWDSLETHLREVGVEGLVPHYVQSRLLGEAMR